MTQNTANLDTVIHKLNGSLRGKKVTILGYAFKKNTGDTRQSQAAEVIRLLQQESPSEIAIYDPQCAKEVIEGELNQIDVTSTFNVCDSPTEACDKSSAVLILTEWDQFSYPAKVSRDDTSIIQFTTHEHLLPEPQCPIGCKDCATSTAAKRLDSGAIDWAHVATIMDVPRLVFDGRGIVDPAGLLAMGIQVETIGRASAITV